MNEKIKQYQLRLFNKLFSTLPNVKKINTVKNELKLTDPIIHIYYFHNKKFWYGKGESEDKYVYIFGPKNKAIHKITPEDATLIIDFDKNTQFNNDSLGLFSIKNSEVHILLNNDILNKKYPYFNAGNLKPTQIRSIDRNLKLNVLDLGSISDDFIENLEKLLLNQGNLKKEDNADSQTASALCSICSKNKSEIKIDSQISDLKNIKQELCGKCIEKIVTAEFYKKVKPLLNGNDTKNIPIAKEKFGNDQLFNYGLKLLEKFDIIRYIGVKNLYYSLDNDSYLVSKYGKFSDENDLLIDKIFKPKTTKTKNKKKEISMRNTTLTRKTTNKMNLFINALKSGKTHDQAYKLAKIDENKVENWYRFGEKGDANYIPFYKEYKPFHPENIERIKKMAIFVDAIKDGDDINSALKKSDLTRAKVRAWYSLGEKDNEDYKEFYLACKILLPEGIPKKESKKIVDNDELMNEFITLIDDGKTNEEAIKLLKIPNFKVKNWINQGKLGNKKYVDFYNAYMIQINKKELKKAKKVEKKRKKQEKEKIKISEELVSNSEKTLNETERACKLCGRKLHKKSKKDICKRCERKQYASKILIKLLRSVKPEIKFKRDDLKILDLSTLQITDYLWTLQEFNLITQENNKYQLKDQKTLEKFIRSSGIDPNEIETEEHTVKLSKTCKKCGKTLEISKFFTSDATEDGLEDNCKDCKKLITAARYLKEIHKFVDYENRFSEDELRTHFPDHFRLQAKIWSLVENDLAIRNFEENYYILTDKETAEEFLNKYYEEDASKQISNDAQKEEKIAKDPKDYTKEDQMKIIIKSISEGKSRKEAAEIAHIPLYKISHWYNEGRQGFGKNNINFYQQLKGLEKINEAKNKELKTRMNNVLDELKTGKEFSQVKNSDENEINDWIEKGKQDIEPYSYFYEAYGEMMNHLRTAENIEYEKKEINRKIFLENFKAGKTKEESAKNANIELSQIHEWYLKGKEGKEPYDEFYEKYNEIRSNNKKPEIPQIEKADLFGNQNTITQMNIILKNLGNGLDENEAVEKSNVSFNTYKYWLNRGKQKFGEIYTKFYEYADGIKTGKYKISETTEENKLEKILTPLPEKYEDSFKSSKMNRTGIAWVNIIGKQWVYQKNVNNNTVKLANSNIYKLYDEVMDNNLPWGIRDVSLAKSVIEGNEELNVEKTTTIKTKESHDSELIDPDIYAPLPKEYEDSFKSVPMNKSGIAWVNKTGTGTLWRYEKRLDGKTITFTDENIYELHKKVKAKNHIWGIRDYEKAKKIIGIPDTFDIPSTIKTKEEKDIKINTEIYAPLPQKYLETFPKQSNQTGIAWVNKIGNQFIYSRKVNGETIKITDDNIYSLHQKVLKQNQIWGIRNYTNARKFIDIPEDYTIPKETKTKETDINPDIYAPLSKEDMSKFNPNMNNKSGIAWVNKVGNNWFYQRQRNGKTIRIGDSDIHKLHEKVIKNKQVWGILDYEKARKTIEGNEIPEIEKSPQPTISSKVNVTFLERQMSKIDVIIKGMIKNNELINVLNVFDQFEEDIKRIVTTSMDNEVDIFIELEINATMMKALKEIVGELGWTINN